MIVIPMAGESARFAAKGYGLPKYMLELGQGTCFDYAISSFQHLFQHETFVFVLRDICESGAFVSDRCARLGIVNSEIVVLKQATEGQAHTVEIGLDAISASGQTSLTIFNIDTFRPDFSFAPEAALGRGYLEIFLGGGSDWSFVEAADPALRLVKRTAEKDPISNMCCTGLYHFGQVSEFRGALDAERAQPHRPLKELYVAPIYNHLVRRGIPVHYWPVERNSVIFCGVPAEYEALRADPTLLPPLSAMTA